jgi:hypothetical protein
MAGSKSNGKRPLDGLVPEELAAGHGLLFTCGGVPKDRADEALGADVVRDLTARGLAHVAPHTPTTAASFQAVSPDLAPAIVRISSLSGIRRSLWQRGPSWRPS